MAANIAELPELLPNFRSHALSGFEQKKIGRLPTPEVLEPIGRQLGVPDRVLDVLVSEPGLTQTLEDSPTARGRSLAYRVYS